MLFVIISYIFLLSSNAQSIECWQAASLPMNIDDSMSQSATALARKQSAQVPTGNANAYAVKNKITEKSLP